MRRIRATVLVALASAMLVAGCSAFMPEIGTVRGADDGGNVNDAGDAAADGDASRADAAPTTVTVTVAPKDAHAFSPPTVTIHVGDTVHWVWDASGHTVTSGTKGNADNTFCSPNDNGCAGAQTSRAGDTYDHRFTTAGTFPYFCRPHFGSGMVGTVIVQ